MMSGDALLPILAEGMQKYRNSQDPTEQQSYKDIVLLLQNNSLLAANTIMYMVRGQVASKCNFLTYSIALTYSDAAILQSCTDCLWSFHYSDKEEKSGNRIK